MGKIKNIKNQKFERLLVVKFLGIDKNHKAQWLCQCDCGNTHIVSTSDLISGKCKSCGCYKKQITILKNTKHNLCKSKIYNAWHNIKLRCYNENHIFFKHYGGRGIIMCDEWKNDFINFYNWAINNGYDENLTIDRIDVNGNYEPSNCRWVTMKVQFNNRRTCKYISYNTETHTVTEWASILKISPSTLFSRLYRGWSVEKTLSTPLIKKS